MRFRLFAYVVILLAVTAVLVAISWAPPVVWEVALLLGAMSFLAHWVALPTYWGGSVSFAFALEFAAVLLGGPLTGAVVALGGALLPQDIASGKPPHRIAFNGSQLVLSTLASGAVLALAGVEPLALTPAPIEEWFLAAVLAAAIQAVVNWTLVGFAVVTFHGVSFQEVWRNEFRSHLLTLVALFLLGIVLAQLMMVAGSVAALLLVVPFVVARQTLQVSQQRAAAFTDTVRGLVEILEVKDPYTRGHSERVAAYSKSIAERVGLSPLLVHRIELAALLHDIGKVGIAVDTLGKQGELSAEEYREIQLHPVTGSSILADIEFLSEVTPLIAAHHERLDGSGYPYGLHAELLPAGAQILAVADCFDAMTTDRAYRKALSFDAAVQELRDEAPQRLDARYVEILLKDVDIERVSELGEEVSAWIDSH